MLYIILSMLARRIFFGLQKAGLVVARGQELRRTLAFSFAFGRKGKERRLEEAQKKLSENVNRE